MAGSSNPDRRRRIPINEDERQKIQRHKKLHPSLSNHDLYQWASITFNQPIDESIISRSLQKKYAYLNRKVVRKDAHIYTSKSIPEWPNLEECLFEWQMRMQNERVHVNRLMVQAVALKLWGLLPQYSRQDPPKFSIGWLEKYKRRHGIRSVEYYGEAASAEVTGEALEVLAEIRLLCTQYQSANILNMDETGLFWQRTPGSSLGTDATLKGKKKDKERVTIGVTVNADGSEKYPP